MMHKDMTEICENAFYGIEECSFYYWGSKEEFKAIKGSKYAPESKMYYFSINKPSEEENDGHYWRYVPDLGPEPWPIEQFTL